MRKIIALTFISLDGVMQAPGGPTEDTSGNFKFGGWTVPYFDEFAGQVMGEQMSKPADLLLGRKTFEIFAGYWPKHINDWPTLKEATKYVASNTLTEHSWEKSVFLNGDVVEQIKKLKQSEGPNLQIHGSANFLQTLLKTNLIDEFWLKTFPVILGEGKKLFEGGAMPAAFTLVDHKVSPSGVSIANYRRSGEVKTGSF